MNCPTCTKEMECIDEVHSNYNSGRATTGEHTGDVYWCHPCESTLLDNFLSGKVEPFDYSL